ncbi:zinc finger protein [Rutstroemia sp. NJR-2017a BVV2]|nr:zinc finger protein [Rutstroemia sp. NJR-2017a BVV2]
MHELVFAHDSNRYITSVEVADAIHSADNIPGNEHSPLPLIADDDSLSEWSVVGDGVMTPTTSDSDWSIIGRNVLTPDHSDNASEWSITSEDLVHISSNTFPSATNLELSSYSAQSQELRCYMCRPDRKPFRNIRAYQAHMNSAAHAPKIFHCPLSFMPQVNQEGPAKVKYFSTLGGLTQHMESGRCDGGLEVYSKAISFVEEQLKLLGFSDFMLLKN